MSRYLEHGDFRHQIRHPGDLPLAGDEDSPLDLPSLFRNQRLKVQHGQEMDIRRVEPIVGKQVGARRPPGEQPGKPDGIVSEIRERDDGAEFPEEFDDFAISNNPNTMEMK